MAKNNKTSATVQYSIKQYSGNTNVVRLYILHCVSKNGPTLKRYSSKIVMIDFDVI